MDSSVFDWYKENRCAMLRGQAMNGRKFVVFYLEKTVSLELLVMSNQGQENDRSQL